MDQRVNQKEFKKCFELNANEKKIQNIWDVTKEYLGENL